MNKIYDVAIVGAGIVGLSTALKLQEQGKNVLVLDKEKSPGTHQSGRTQELFILEFITNLNLSNQIFALEAENY